MTMDVILEQALAGCIIIGYYFLTRPKADAYVEPMNSYHPPKRGRSSSRSSTEDSAYHKTTRKELADRRRRHVGEVVALWLVFAAGLASYRILARLSYERCTMNTLKIVLAILNPSECAAYSMYMNYMRSFAAVVVFGIIARVWRFFGIDPDSVYDAHASLKRIGAVWQHPREV